MAGYKARISFRKIVPFALKPRQTAAIREMTERGDEKNDALN